MYRADSTVSIIPDTGFDFEFIASTVSIPRVRFELQGREGVNLMIRVIGTGTFVDLNENRVNFFRITATAAGVSVTHTESQQEGSLTSKTAFDSSTGVFYMQDFNEAGDRQAFRVDDYTQQRYTQTFEYTVGGDTFRFAVSFRYVLE